MVARNGESIGAPAPCARTRVGASAGPSSRSSGSGEAGWEPPEREGSPVPSPPPGPPGLPRPPRPPRPPAACLDGGILELYPTASGTPSRAGGAATANIVDSCCPWKNAMPKTSLSPEATLERSLARMVQRLREAAEDNLLGVATYGAPAKSRHASGSGAAEVNILVVVANATLQALLPLAPVLTSAQRQSQVSSFVVTPAELRVDAQLFPARLLEIRLTHRLLYRSEER